MFPSVAWCFAQVVCMGFHVFSFQFVVYSSSFEDDDSILAVSPAKVSSGPACRAGRISVSGLPTLLYFFFFTHFPNGILFEKKISCLWPFLYGGSGFRNNSVVSVLPDKAGQHIPLKWFHHW